MQYMPPSYLPNKISKDFYNLFDLNKTLPINVIDGKLSFNSNISGVLNKSFLLTSNIDLSNLILKDKEYGYPIDIKKLNLTFKGDDKKYNGEVLCSDIGIQAQKEKIFLSVLNILFDNKKINVFFNWEAASNRSTNAESRVGWIWILSLPLIFINSENLGI